MRSAEAVPWGTNRLYPERDRPSDMPKTHLPVAKPFYGPEEEQAVVRVLRSGWVTQGPEVAALEREFADYCGARHGIAVANCTVALHLSLVAAGVGAGDEVITVSHSFIAGANAIRYVGAVPVFVDVALNDFDIDPAKIEAAITPKTKAILPVHQLGMPARMEEIRAIAERRKLILIEDAACSAGLPVESEPPVASSGWNRRCETSAAPAQAPIQMPNVWLARPTPSAESAAAPASGCTIRLAALATSLGINLLSGLSIVSTRPPPAPARRGGRCG